MFFFSLQRTDMCASIVKKKNFVLCLASQSPHQPAPDPGGSGLVVVGAANTTKPNQTTRPEPPERGVGRWRLSVAYLESTPPLPPLFRLTNRNQTNQSTPLQWQPRPRRTTSPPGRPGAPSPAAGSGRSRTPPPPLSASPSVAAAPPA